MRHRKANVKLGRTASHRKAMLRNMASSLFMHNSIVTTVSKAKALRPITDRIIKLAKIGDLTSMRRCAPYFSKWKLVKKLFASVKENNFFQDRNCGYSTMTRVGIRRGDAAVLVRVGLIGSDFHTTAKKPKSGRAADRSKRVAASKAKQEEQKRKAG
ncbi:MAG: 50S ribosomal protein L17 [Deltaproteobacteria bacterium]|jgi:large subunit ribosomal protein L17|nr:50S ribosomal protein L17 [Deltaproteobacteria bacterium]